MALGKGTKLGHCEILSPLGAGGMGEVYRANDAKLRLDGACRNGIIGWSLAGLVIAALIKPKVVAETA